MGKKEKKKKFCKDLKNKVSETQLRKYTGVIHILRRQNFGIFWPLPVQFIYWSLFTIVDIWRTPPSPISVYVARLWMAPKRTVQLQKLGWKEKEPLHKLLQFRRYQINVNKNKWPIHDYFQNRSPWQAMLPKLLGWRSLKMAWGQ